MSQTFDLFGDPIPERWGRRGRPQHIATLQNRNKVSMLLAFGWNNERIARALSITPPTLRKNYFRELKFREEMRDRMDARLAEKLWDQVEAGNVGAMREFRKFIEQNDLMIYGQTARPGGNKPEKEAKLGKKEAALAAAQNPDRDSTLGDLMARRQGLAVN
jgi:hypothetical protein